MIMFYYNHPIILFNMIISFNVKVTSSRKDKIVSTNSKNLS